MRAAIVIVCVLASTFAWAEPVAGPSMYYVDADGHYLGIFRDAVDSETVAIVARVVVPAGAVQVPSAPSGPGMKWDAGTSAWITDPDYVAPVVPSPEPSAWDVLDLLVEAGVITAAQRDSLLGQ